MTEYEINGKEYEVDYDLDNRIIKVDVDNNDVEKYRRLVGILDLESEANVARRVSSREADANQYRYDALGRRVIRQEGTTKTALIWWSNSEKHRRLVDVLDRMSGASEARRVKAREASLNQCAEHKHQAGQTVIQNDIMAHPSRLNSVIARAVDGSKFKLEWYHKNYLDHVYAVSDDSGDILEHYRHSAFGEVQIYNASGTQVTTTQIDNHILWNTRRRDELTGYYMYKFRHYSAELGRWLARDPIEERAGISLYAFVGNDPIGRWDRLGLATIYLDGIINTTLELLPANEPKVYNPDEAPQDYPTHAWGLFSIRSAVFLLEDACEKNCPSDCEKDGCTVSKCKEDARKAVDAIAASWTRNYGLGSQTANACVAGFFCYDWIDIYIDALEKEQFECISFKRGVAIDVVDLNQKLDASSDERFEDTVRTHHYLKMFACNKADISTQVTFDDGFLSLGGGLSHFGVFPNVESPYKDLPDNEIKNFPPNTKPTPFIPAP